MTKDCCCCMQGKAANGKLGTLTVAKLQLYMELHGLAKAGKKEDLVMRITNHLANKLEQ